MQQRLELIKNALESQRTKLLAHPVYTNISDIIGLQKFTQVHVFAVWDFMSLLKSLQIALTSVTLPWQPVGSATTRYLINEIVLGEESDVDEAGVRISHFELYLKAMQQMGADTSTIQLLLQKINLGENIIDAINQTDLHKNVKAFLHFTFDIALHAPTHVKAAVFTFGREDLIPSMFIKLLEQLYAEIPEKISTFKYYIERHIEVDGDHHSRLAIEMVAELCGDDETKWNEALETAKKSLEMRYLLWDAIMG
ncbi:MAG: hypothetical protein RLY16_675 [Bacteroidota bacterium]